MPELRECYAHYLMATNFWQSYGSTSDFKLLAIWADRSKKENEKGLGVEAVNDQEAYVSRIDGSYNYLRGTIHHQTALYPHHELLLLAAAAKTNALDNISSPLSVLSLVGFEHTARSLILNFGKLYFQLSFLTHTSIQIYTRDQWESSIQLAQKQHRRFKIAVCFEFAEYFLAFPSHDMLVQPIWGVYPAPERLGIDIPYVWNDFNAFLAKIVSWAEPMLHQSSCSRTLAITQIMKDEEIWPGVGVYTSSELFFDAGISPFISLYELVSVPSRLARLACAYLSFALKSRDFLWEDLLKPAMVDGILAPTLDQRLKYKDWLHVWAKEKCRVTNRMKQLILAYNARLSSILESTSPSVLFRMELLDLYDPFEPVFIQAGLDAAPYLGPTIFGDAWVGLKGRPVSAMVQTPNLLDEMYSRVQQTQNFINVHMHPFLEMAHYDDVLYAKFTPIICKYVIPQAYQVSGNAVWTVLSEFSPTIKIVRPIISSEGPKGKGKCGRNIGMPSALIKPYTQTELTLSYFGAIVSGTEGVAIGPLEYCGNGHVFKDSHKKLILHIIPLDPQLTESQIINQTKRANRRKLNKSSKSSVGLKQGMSQSQANKCNSQIQKNINTFYSHRNTRSASVSSTSSHSSHVLNANINDNEDDEETKAESEDEDSGYPPKISLPHTPPFHSDNDEDIPVITKRRRRSQDQRLESELQDLMTGTGSSSMIAD